MAGLRLIKGALSRTFSIYLNSQNIYLCRRPKPTNNGLFLLPVAILVRWNFWQVSLAEDGEDGNGLQLENLRLHFSGCFPARLQIIDIDGRGLFSLCELRIYLPLVVERQCSEWIKLATTNFQGSLGQKFARSP